MKHSLLIRQSLDNEFRRRYGRFFRVVWISAVPLAVFAVLLWLRCGAVLLHVFGWTGLAYALVLVALHVLGRREVLAAMRREKLVEHEYRPPFF